MKILSVTANGRRRAFEVHTRSRTYFFPYSKAVPIPSGANPVVNVAPDPELGNEGFTYALASGREGSIHIDSVREVNHDPKYIAELLLYRLSVEAQHRMNSSGKTARVVARALNTSPAQLYRLMDPTNYSKSFRQLISLLNYLGVNVDFQMSEARNLKSRPRRHATSVQGHETRSERSNAVAR
ncbi:MAG: hypothetical protein ACHQFZ_05230 [Acidimicrobiales bacterium]